MSVSTPLTATSIAYLTEGIDAFSVHPDFNGGGNVLVLCRNDDSGVGFRVSGFHLSAVRWVTCPTLPRVRLTPPSPTFKAALVGHLHTPCTLHLTDSADDMAAFLRLFKLAPSASWAKFDPPMATYYRVLVLLEKYHCHDFMRAAFAAKVAGSGRYAGDGAGWEPFYLLIMAHRLRSSSIWAHILPRLAKWRVDPASMTAEQVAVLGPELYRIVVGISAYSAGGRAFQDLKGVSVTYPGGLRGGGLCGERAGGALTSRRRARCGSWPVRAVTRGRGARTLQTGSTLHTP